MSKNDDQIPEELKNSIMLEQLYAQLQAPKLMKFKAVLQKKTTIIIEMEAGFAMLLSILILDGAAGRTQVSGILTRSAFEQLINMSHQILNEVAKEYNEFTGLKKFFKESTGKILPPQNEKFYKNISRENMVEISISGLALEFPLLAMFINEISQGDEEIFKMLTPSGLENFKSLGNDMIKQVEQKMSSSKEKINKEDWTSMITSWLDFDSKRISDEVEKIIKGSLPPDVS